MLRPPVILPQRMRPPWSVVRLTERPLAQIGGPKMALKVEKRPPVVVATPIDGLGPRPLEMATAKGGFFFGVHVRSGFFFKNKTLLSDLEERSQRPELSRTCSVATSSSAVDITFTGNTGFGRRES